MFLSAVSKVSNSKTQLFRSVVSHTIQQKAHYGKNGHFDVIIVGGGAAGISLAGTIGKLLETISNFCFYNNRYFFFWQENRRNCKIKKYFC